MAAFEYLYAIRKIVEGVADAKALRGAPSFPKKCTHRDRRPGPELEVAAWQCLEETQRFLSFGELSVAGAVHGLVQIPVPIAVIEVRRLKGNRRSAGKLHIRSEVVFDAVAKEPDHQAALHRQHQDVIGFAHHKRVAVAQKLGFTLILRRADVCVENQRDCIRHRTRVISAERESVVRQQYLHTRCITVSAWRQRKIIILSGRLPCDEQQYEGQNRAETHSNAAHFWSLRRWKGTVLRSPIASNTFAGA